MKNAKAAHGTFTIEKIYKASAEAVFSAWADLNSRAQWFVGPGDDWKVVRREMDFRVGGHEVLHSRFGNGFEPLYEARFYNIIPNRQIVFVYDMHLNGEHHSVSLASIEIEKAERPIFSTTWLRSWLRVRNICASIDSPATP